MIAIKMEMPSCCMSCRLGDVVNCGHPKIANGWYEDCYIDGRPADCPLKNVSVLQCARLYSAEEAHRYGEDKLQELIKRDIVNGMAKSLSESGRIHYQQSEEECFSVHNNRIDGRVYVVDM